MRGVVGVVVMEGSKDPFANKMSSLFHADMSLI